MSSAELSRSSFLISRPICWGGVGLLAAVLLAGCPVISVAQDSSLATIDALVRQSRLDEAEKQLQAILQKQPANTRALALLGVVRRQQGNWPEAESFFRRAVASNPRSLEAGKDLAQPARPRGAQGPGGVLARQSPLAQSRCAVCFLPQVGAWQCPGCCRSRC